MTAAAAIPARSAPANAPSSRGGGLGLAVVWLGIGVALSVYAAEVAVEARAAALTWVIVEIFTLCLIGGALVLRDPRGALRLSNPVLLLLGWMFYYFVKPAISWLQGYRMALESTSTVILDVEVVSRIQQLHCYFAVALFAAYFVAAPREVPVAMLRDKDAPRIQPWVFVLVGLAPYLSNIIEVFLTTGRVTPGANYGDITGDLATNIESSRNEGGAGYLLTQILSKVWYLPLMSLGFGYALILSRLIMQRRRAMIALFFLQVPVLLLVGSGGRSYTAFPFLLALILTDAFVGPLRWLRFVPLAGIALPLFDLYGVYRGFQHEGPTAALSSSLNEMQRNTDMVNTEEAVMLTKEAYCELLTRHGYASRGIEYFTDSIVQLLPAQIAPEKLQLRSTAEFLSTELLGVRRNGGGVAGTIIGDGLFIGGDLGVVVLALILGAILGLVVRWGVQGGDGKTTFWRYVLMLMISVQTTQYIRADLNVVLTQLLYYVLIPAAVMRLLLEAKAIAPETWSRAFAPLTPR
jgi:hypothetical protein